MIESAMWFYCFCDEYQECMQHNLMRRYCKLGEINQSFTDFEEVLTENKYNKQFLIWYAHELFADLQKQLPEVFYEKRCSYKFCKSKHQCESLFFNNVADLRPATLLKKDSGTCVFL